MNFAIKIIILIAVAFLVTVAWACCVAAHTADEDAERMYKAYLEWKNRKEKENEEEEY